MLILSLIAAASVALSATPRYTDCVTLVDADLEIGRIAAQQWVNEGGGADARHCLAGADIKAGFPKLAAVRLEEIAERDDAGDDYMRAQVLNQAALAWLQAEQPALAKAALEKAQKIVPDSGELQITAAKIYGVEESWQDVIEAVTTAEKAKIVSAETFVLRGRGRYIFGAYERAADDVVAALSLEPTNIDALVLRGDLAQVGIKIDVYFDPPNR